MENIVFLHISLAVFGIAVISSTMTLIVIRGWEKIGVWEMSKGWLIYTKLQLSKGKKC